MSSAFQTCYHLHVYRLVSTHHQEATHTHIDTYIRYIQAKAHMIHMYRTHSKTKHFITIKSLNQIYENASVVITCGQQYLYTRFPFYYCMLYQISIYDEIYTCHRACKCRLSPFFAPHFLISSEFAKKPESVLSKTSLSSIYFLSVKTSRLENFPIHP